MIAGLFIRNYKCYSNLNFIPLAYSDNEKINVFIGSNGVGKSSLLEAISCIMNEIDPRSWETTLNQKKDRTYIGPIFLIKKTSFPHSQQIQAISDSFWSGDFPSSKPNDAAAEFTTWRNELKKNINHEEYLLFCIGKNYEGDVLLTQSFHTKIFNQTKRLGVSKQHISDLLKQTISHYNYIYIPIENKISDMLDLQAYEMQGLMDKSIADEIREILSSKDYDNNGDGKKLSAIDLINKKLDNYIEEINNALTSGYKFSPKGTNKKSIKPNDILHIVLSEYFSIRPLTKDGKHIKSLSSGQQRLALIDVATTLLSQNGKNSENIVLAIDEPENSLEAANRFKQFSRLVNIAEKNGHQVFITTHWYGLLLRPSRGRLSFVNESEEDNEAPRISCFPMQNLYDKRREFPDSIEMKSYFDLMSSMLSLLKQEKFNWIICEGLEDADYLTHYLKDSCPDLYILPFNGCGNIKKLFEFLTVPFSDKSESQSIKGKVLCLIDTDEKNLISIDGYKAKPQLRFERFLLDRDTDKSSLISVASPNATNTCIEDTLNPKIMYKAFIEASKSSRRIQELSEEYSWNSDAKHADITKKLAFLTRETKLAHESSDLIKKFLTTQEIKKLISIEYIKKAKDSPHTEPAWVSHIRNFFLEK